MDSNEYRTPPETFDPLRYEFRLTFDAAATVDNHLLPDFCTKGSRWATINNAGSPRLIMVSPSDGLTSEWLPKERVWCNPPYSAPLVSKFVAKCAEHAKAGGLAVMLLNASTTDTRWFHKHIWDAKMHRPRERVEVRFLPKRICFLDEAGVPQKSPRYSNMVCIFYPWDVAA